MTGREVPWGDSPYDTKTPAEVVHDYAVVRGDLSAQYARDQLAGWIERYAVQRSTVTRAAIVDKIEEMALAILSDPEGDPAGAPVTAAILRQAAEVARWAHPEGLA